MKQVFTMLTLLIVTTTFAQSDNLAGIISEEKENTMVVRDLKISITIDSAEDIDKTFSIKDIQDIIEIADADENISFEILLKDKSGKEGVSKSISYKIEGNTDEKDSFIAFVRRIRNASKEFYNK